VTVTYGPAAFAGDFDVSRETLERLESYVSLLQHWNQRINLVSQGTLGDVWRRHIADSAQLLDLAPAGATRWIDLGTGAGLPGLVVAALAAEKHPTMAIRLVESDARKAAFLAEVGRAMGVDATIECCRIESLPPEPHDVVSARALAPVIRLCALAQRFAGPETIYLFPKGARLESELTEAASAWHICAERISSRTDPEAAILRIRGLRPRS